MADARSGMGSHREGRQERTAQPKQPGASGRGGKQRGSKEEAIDKTTHRRGKTGKHVSDDR
jgi:hypothetical protein